MNEDGGSLGRAARRIEWASRALTAAAADLQAVGATAAADVVGEEAACVDRLAGEVRKLAKAKAT